MKVIIVSAVLCVLATAALAEPNVALGPDDATLREQFGGEEEDYAGLYQWHVTDDGQLRLRRSDYHHQQEVHAGPAKAYTYPSPAPKVKCPSSLLLSCQPNVAHVPCVSPPAGYGHAAPAHYGHAAPASYNKLGSPQY
jgi:Vitelline membrane cysteine-rich region